MSNTDSNGGAAVSVENCWRISGPFFHGTSALLHEGEELVAGCVSNFDPGRVMNNIYFTSLIETAIWGAELAAALSGAGQVGYVYEVAPTGAFEDDPNVTDKKSPGNATRSYRSAHPLRVVRTVHRWQGHDPATLENMLGALRLLREQGRDIIED